jgi:hypothetical protein
MVEHIKALGYRKPDGSEWLRKDFRRIVLNPTYAGFIAWGRNHYRTPSKYLKDYEVSYVFRAELQLVPIELWEAANKIRKERAANVKSPGKWAKHVFSGLLACPFCKGPMYGRTSLDYRGQKPTERMKYYCYTHSQIPSKCPGKSFQASTVNKALMPFLASAIEDNLWLNDALNEAINLFGKDNLEKSVEQEIRARLITTQEKMNRLTQAIAEGILLKAEARDTMAELRETKGRLERELAAIAEKEAIREDYLRAVKAQQSSDLEAELWDMLENSPRALQRLARMIISPGSVVIATEGKSKAVKSRVESYEFTPDFKGICETFYTQRGGLEPQPFNAGGRGQPVPAASGNN